MLLKTGTLGLVGALVFGAWAVIPSRSAPPAIHTGSFSLPEISGAALAGNRLLVAADDAEDSDDRVKQLHMIGLLDVKRLAETAVDLHESEQLYGKVLKKISPAADWEFATDIEDIATGPDGRLYLISSHSLNKKGNRPAKRQRLIRLTLDPTTGAVRDVAVSKVDLIKALPDELSGSAKDKPGDLEHPGLNIEGLAVTPSGEMLFGLRSPLADGKAIVLRVDSVDRLFDPSAAKQKLEIYQRLNLGGRGIRGMAFDPTTFQYWLIAGLAADPDSTSPAPNDWAVINWDGAGRLTTRFNRSTWPEVGKMDAPEAICVLPAQKSLLLVGDNGQKQRSPFAVIPLSKLPK